MIDDVRLPVDIERGAHGGPGFKTTVITMSSGHETRNQDWSIARGRWNIGYGIQTRDHLSAVIDFFYARAGRARGFRFRDWLDFKVTGELCDPVPDEPTQRQLVKLYGDPVNPYSRNIVLPIVDTLIVYVDNLATEDYTLDGGIIEFAADPGENVRATFEFDVPARFDTDELGVSLNTYNEGAIPTITIVELRG